MQHLAILIVIIDSGKNSSHMVKHCVKAYCIQDICGLKIYPNRLLRREKNDKEMLIVDRTRCSMYESLLSFSCNFSVNLKVILKYYNF